jgi:hypothetical protein
LRGQGFASDDADDCESDHEPTNGSHHPYGSSPVTACAGGVFAKPLRPATFKKF